MNPRAIGKSLNKGAILSLGVAVLLLFGCGDNSDGLKPKAKAAKPDTSLNVKGDGMHSSDNPARQQGVTVYRPKALANATYNRATRVLLDLGTGNLLERQLRRGHMGEPESFSFSNQRTGLIASGRVAWWSSSNQSVYNVVSLSTKENGSYQYRSREEYNISTIAEMFRAGYDLIDPHHKKEVLVVDSRPEKALELNPINGNRKATS